MTAGRDLPEPLDPARGLKPLDLPGRAGITVLWVAFGPDAAAAREKALVLAQTDADEALRRARAAWAALRTPEVRDPLVWRGGLAALVCMTERARGVAGAGLVVVRQARRSHHVLAYPFHYR